MNARFSDAFLVVSPTSCVHFESIQPARIIVAYHDFPELILFISFDVLSGPGGNMGKRRFPIQSIKLRSKYSPPDDWSSMSDQ